MKKIVETKKLDTDKIKVGRLKFDKDAYDKMVLDVLIEQEAKKTEERLTREREMIRSGIFKLSRKNVANGNNERTELLHHIDFLATESEDKSERKLYKKVFNILEEMAKNVQKDKYYYNKKENEEYKKYELGEVNIISDENSITITTSNYTKDDISRIQERLDELNEMDESELKEEYRTKMNTGNISERGGAGLGFIDIIRKSGGGKLKCTIEETEIPEIKKISFTISTAKDNISKSKEAFAA